MALNERKDEKKLIVVIEKASIQCAPEGPGLVIRCHLNIYFFQTNASANNMNDDCLFILNR